MPLFNESKKCLLSEKDEDEGEDERRSLISAMRHSPDYSTIDLSDEKNQIHKANSFSRMSQVTSESSVVPPSTAEPVTLTWNNLNVQGRQKKSLLERIFKKTSTLDNWTPILKNVSGIVKSGQLVALMGASGAGKSTLLNTLTHRNTSGLRIDGDMMVNGVKIGRKITNISAYIQQTDLFIGAFTVREHLTFQALLRLPKTLSKENKMKRVEEVLHELGLIKCADTMIGIRGQGRGISGGEAKRLAFASEILTNPRILFCDEPTTGLDSYMAENVVNVLSGIANRGRTVLCTIHQPPSEVFAKFHTVMLLAEGSLAFYGSSKKALEFFESQGYTCPIDYNPADYFIQRLAIVPGKEERRRNMVQKLCKDYKNGPIWEKYKNKIESYSIASPGTTIRTDYKSKAISWVGQFLALLWRANLSGWRNKRLSFVRLGQKIFMALFVGLLYLRTPLSQTSISNINGAMYFMLMQFTMSSIMTVLRSLPAEFPVLTREHHNGIYGVTAYYFSKVLANIPLFGIDGLVFMIIVFWMVGLTPTVTCFLGTVAVGVLVEEVSCSFGTMLSTVAPNFPVALTIAGPILTVLQITGGLFANVGTLPVYISWVQYLSWWKLGFELFACFQWQEVTNIPCDLGKNITCIHTGKQVLDSLSFSSSSIGLNIGLLFVMLFAFYLIAGVALKIRTYKSR